MENTVFENTLSKKSILTWQIGILQNNRNEIRIRRIANLVESCNIYTHVKIVQILK